MGSRRVFHVALGFSALLHLSMVTVFSIAVWLPVQHVDYYEFDIVEVPESGPAPAAELPFDTALSVPDIDTNLNINTAGAATATRSIPSALPAIELPRLQFAELERVRAREQSLEIRTRYDLEGSPSDSWGRAVSELAELGDVLKRMRLWGGEAAEENANTQPVSRPAPGVQVYVEWMTDPRDRKLLLSPPIRALENADALLLSGPVSLVFKVDQEGRVIEVLSSVDDTSSILSEAGKALLGYRFEPLASDNAREQYGTLVITSDTANLLP